MTLFEILSLNERIIVWSDENEETIYTWNQSLTLQSFRQLTERGGIIGTGNPMPSAEWEEVDVRTLANVPRDISEARTRAREWSEA